MQAIISLISYDSKFTKFILILIIAPESQALESDYFYKINAIRAKEKTGPFTDVSTFDRNDGVIVDQSISQLQQGGLSATFTNSCYYLYINWITLPILAFDSNFVIKEW